MQMVDRLASLSPDVRYDSIAIHQTKRLRQLADHFQTMPKRWDIFISRISNAANLFARYHQHVNRSLWIDVVKGDTQFVAMNELRGNLAS